MVLSDKQRKAMFAKIGSGISSKKSSDYPESFYEKFWNTGANGLYEWYGDVAEDDARLSKNDYNETNYRGLRPDWKDISDAGKAKLRRVIKADWAGDDLVDNPNLIEVRSGWEKPNGEDSNTYTDPNSYKNKGDIPDSVADDILNAIDNPSGYVKSTTFKPDRVTIDDLRVIKKKSDDKYDESRLSQQLNHIKQVQRSHGGVLPKKYKDWHQSLF